VLCYAYNSIIMCPLIWNCRQNTRRVLNRWII
jgi:hypothetical protein